MLRLQVWAGQKLQAIKDETGSTANGASRRHPCSRQGPPAAASRAAASIAGRRPLQSNRSMRLRQRHAGVTAAPPRWTPRDARGTARRAIPGPAATGSAWDGRRCPRPRGPAVLQRRTRCPSPGRDSREKPTPPRCTTPSPRPNRALSGPRWRHRCRGGFRPRPRAACPAEWRGR